MDVLRTSASDVPWSYIEAHIGTSIGRLSGTSSGRPRDVILPSESIGTIFMNSGNSKTSHFYRLLINLQIK